MKKMGDTESYIRSLIGKLYQHFHSLLGVVSQTHHGVVQQINSDELIFEHHNVETVFSVAASSGATLGKDTADRRLGNLTHPDRLYSNTYLRKHSLRYVRQHDDCELDHKVAIQGCHVVLLMDNLVKLQFLKNREPGLCTTQHLNTLPITLCGIPKDSTAALS